MMVQRTGSGSHWWWRLTAVAVLFLMIREYFDPFIVLYLADIFQPKPDPHTLLLSDILSLKVYGDTRPHVGKIDGLQKGLMLMFNDKPLIEEGYGFGLPIIQYQNQPYVSVHAEVSQPDNETLVKRFNIDTADRWSKFLQVKYKSVPSLGHVVVTYTVQMPDIISVAVDLSGLSVAWDTAYIMNEQGARSFPIYENSDGVRQHGDELGIWHASEDVFGCWIHRDEAVRFCVETDLPRRRFVGRERYNQYNWVGIYTLSWSGIDIELTAPEAVYTYKILVGAVDDF